MRCVNLFKLCFFLKEKWQENRTCNIFVKDIVVILLGKGTCMVGVITIPKLSLGGFSSPFLSSREKNASCRPQIGQSWWDPYSRGQIDFPSCWIKLGFCHLWYWYWYQFKSLVLFKVDTKIGTNTGWGYLIMSTIVLRSSTRRKCKSCTRWSNISLRGDDSREWTSRLFSSWSWELA